MRMREAPFSRHGRRGPGSAVYRVMNTTKNETLTKYVGDLHALVSHGEQAIARQVESLKNVSHKDAAPAVREFHRVLEKQKGELQTRLSALGGSASNPVKDAVSAVAGVAAGLIDAVRPSETVKSLRDDYTFFSHLGIAYLLLHTTSSSLGDTETATLAESGYRDTARLMMHCDRILPKITVEELREGKLNAVDVDEKTHAMVKAAWDRQKPTLQ